MTGQMRVLLVIALVVLVLLGGTAGWMILTGEGPASGNSLPPVTDANEDTVAPAPVVNAPVPENVRPQPASSAATRDEPMGTSKPAESAHPATSAAPPVDQPDVRTEDDVIVVDFVDKSFHSVVHFLALKSGLNVSVEGTVQVNVTVKRKIPNTQEAVLDLLTEICEMNDLSLTHNGQFVVIKNR